MGSGGGDCVNSGRGGGVLEVETLIHALLVVIFIYCYIIM